MNSVQDTPLTIAGKTFGSRLMVGTGKYRNSVEMNAAFEASGAEIITVALRRIDFDDPASRSVLDDVDWKRYTILPNTASCATADEAIRIARMVRAMELSNWIKLEVIPDPKYLLPDPIGTLEAAKVLIDDHLDTRDLLLRMGDLNAGPVADYVRYRAGKDLLSVREEGQAHTVLSGS